MRTIALVLIAFLSFHMNAPADEPLECRDRPLVLAHYMPWYVAKPVSPQWGWHWTMNRFDPETINDGRRDVASHHYPLAGAYDSSDPSILEYHLLLMKLCGIDGVIVDWYGLTDLSDYAVLHRNTQRLIDAVERMEMQFAICYEDQTVTPLVKEGRISADQIEQHVATEIDWLAENWFMRPGYVRLDGKPVLLSFGNTGLSGPQWTSLLKHTRTPLAYFSEHTRRDGATGAFDWPIPDEGLLRSEHFDRASLHWPDSIPAVYPRFVDVYAKANVNDGYVRIADNDGKTFLTTMRHAFASGTRIIQLVTWNDWGEGTCIEPSVEFGYRDLEALQNLRRRRSELKLNAGAEDLRLPWQLLQQRRNPSRQKDVQRWDAVAVMIGNGDFENARKALAQ